MTKKQLVNFDQCGRFSVKSPLHWVSGLFSQLVLTNDFPLYSLLNSVELARQQLIKCAWYLRYKTFNMFLSGKYLILRVPNLKWHQVQNLSNKNEFHLEWMRKKNYLISKDFPLTVIWKSTFNGLLHGYLLS